MNSDFEGRDEVFKDILAPGAFAVVVIDKQNAYFTSDPDRPGHIEGHTKAADRIDEFLVWVRQHKAADIMWVRMYENLDESPENIRLKRSTRRLKNISKRGEESFEYFGLNPEDGEAEFVKNTYDIFGSAEFVEELDANKQTKTLVLVGGLTSRCVLASAFSASTRGYHVVIPTDLVGVPDVFSHEEGVAFEIVDGILGYLIDGEELKKVISAA